MRVIARLSESSEMADFSSPILGEQKESNFRVASSTLIMVLTGVQRKHESEKEVE